MGGLAVKMEMLREIDLARFLQHEDDGRVFVSCNLRPADPFPNVLVAISRILVAEGKIDTNEILRKVSPDTRELDEKWLNGCLQVLQSHMKRYVPRDAYTEPWDVIYNDTRSVLK